MRQFIVSRLIGQDQTMKVGGWMGMKQKIWLGGIFCSIALLVQLFQWALFDWLTPFMMVPIDALMWICLIGFSVWALVELVRLRKSLGWKRAGMPLAVYLVTILLLIFVPFTAIYLHFDYKWHFKERQAVATRFVEMSKQEQPFRNQVVPLPDAEKHLSNGGGDVIVDSDSRNKVAIVFFFTFRGILDNFAGFMYRSDSSYPKKDDLGGNLSDIEPMGAHWFWVSSR
jgi:hypothetical protein